MIDGSIKHKKAKCVNNNVVATMSHGEYKDVLLNKQCLRHSGNIIQSKYHRIGTYFALFWWQKGIQNNGYNELCLGS